MRSSQTTVEQVPGELTSPSITELQYAVFILWPTSVTAGGQTQRQQCQSADDKKHAMKKGKVGTA